VSESWIGRELKTIWRWQPGRRSWRWGVEVAAFLIVVGAVSILPSLWTSLTEGVRSPSQAGVSLPSPVPQSITRTGGGAQVAWLWTQGRDEQPSLVAVDPAGRLVAGLDRSTAQGMAAMYGVWRSADGSTVFGVGSDRITAYSALDGKVQRAYSRQAGSVVADAFSPDGRWLAMLVLDTDLQVQVIDLRSGSSQVAPVARDQNAKLPGMSCSAGASCAASVVWGMAVFAPDSARLYTLTDWGGPARLTAFSLDGARLVRTATAVDGQQGRTLPSCAGPAMVAKVVAGGQTLVAFCHFDGAVWFFDLSKLTSSGVINTHQGNPFWLSPIFTPDGQLLYLHQWPGFGDTMQVVDLTQRRLLGPVPTPTRQDQGGPFAGLIVDAHAGGVASSVPISPDGRRLYSAADDGVMVLRVPDLKPIARLSPGLKSGEVWISGDGKTVYATADDGRRLVVMSADGSHQKSVWLPGQAGGFIASEHG
jgi:WD40 repeat protein